MASFNRVVLVGNTTRDVELRRIPSGTEVCDLGLAINDRRKDANGNWIEETTFVDVTLWGRTAQVAEQYTRKGSSVLIEGRLKMDTWDSDGQKRSKLKVIADRLVLLGSRQGGGSSGGPIGDGSYGQYPQNRQGGSFQDSGQGFNPGDLVDDEIPF